MTQTAIKTDNQLDALCGIEGVRTLVRRFIPTDAIEIVEARVNRLVKRADAKGFPKPVLLLGPTEVRKVCANPIESMDIMVKPVYEDVEYTEIAIVAHGTLAIAGWHLLAVIAPVVQADNTTIGMPTIVPGETARLDLIENWNRCDHCKARRFRTETFVVENESGERKQIGRNCLRDFLGHDPSAMVAWLDATFSLVTDEDVLAWGSSAERLYSPDQIIAFAARIVATDGRYVGKAKAEIENTSSTMDHFWWGWNARGKAREEFDEDFPYNHPAIQPLIASTTKALALLAETPAEKIDNDWMWSIRNTTGLKYVQRRQVGIIASAVILGQRLQEREAREVAQVAQAKARAAAVGREPQHLGAIGQRLTIPVTVEFSRSFDGQYGTRTLVKFRTAEGDLVQWWATGFFEVENGAQVTVTGTVKAHETDRYSKEPVTVLTRCKVA